ncbi:trypsin-like serine protease [Pseudobacteriovorax antillogorgiicola]|uniref:Trypsin n=1 Tax=Pseudobacteriovorax antillogorgiicola TaxID=1513793 RepID=A0A1Y6BR63_9BACT|nr:trypsin-like serine protease [Pseudobacteriovorax antillogorgiicola]TCS54655.1 trypsin [Pseudobacteriovorax antillogorgiicola]SMF16857.1 Trypsin [Pseudobacteriovorax antillogorgiicola]
MKYPTFLTFWLTLSCSQLPHESELQIVSSPEHVVRTWTPVSRASLAMVERAEINAIPYCSAVLIAPEIALTAAHCVEEESYSPGTQVTLSFGKGLLDEPVFWEGRFTRHEAFNAPYVEPLDFDIAYIEIDGNHPQAEPIDIADHEDLEEALQNCSVREESQLAYRCPQKGPSNILIAGFGDTWSPEDKTIVSNSDGQLRQAFTRIDRIESMENLLQQGKIFYQSPVSADPSVEILNTACRGDSGGPMLINTLEGWKLIGITRGSNYVSSDQQCLDGAGNYTNVVFWNNFTISEDGVRFYEDGWIPDNVRGL